MRSAVGGDKCMYLIVVPAQFDLHGTLETAKRCGRVLFGSSQLMVGFR